MKRTRGGPPPDGESGGEGPAAEGVSVEGLTPKQEQAVVALLHHPTVTRAASAVGVGERTLHTWLHEPAFSRAYRRARRESFAHAVALTQQYAALAVNTLARLLTDPSCGTSSKVAAASALLKFGRESIELDDIAMRVDLLEQSLPLQAGSEPGPWGGP